MKTATMIVLIIIFVVGCDTKHFLVETLDEVSQEAGSDYSDYQGMQ